MSFREDFVIHFLQKSRHRRENVGFQLDQVLLDFGQVLGVVHRKPEVLPRVIHHALIDVAKGEEAQNPIVLGSGDDGQDGFYIGKEIAVGEHHAFRETRRTGGID